MTYVEVLQGLVPAIMLATLGIGWQIRQQIGVLQGSAAQWKIEFAQIDAKAVRHSGVIKEHGLELVQIDERVLGIKEDVTRIESKLDQLVTMIMDGSYKSHGQQEDAT